MKLRTFLLFFLASWGIRALHAEESFDFSGFGSFGAVYNQSKDYGFRTDLSQSEGAFESDLAILENSILGFQTNYEFSPNFSAVYQAAYHNQNSLNFGSLTSQAFIKYQPDAQWTYRFGRMPMDLFLLTEYRDVNFAIPWAHTPSELYGLVPYRYFDGLDISYTKNFGNYNLRTKIGTGVSHTDVASLDITEEINLKSVVGISLEWQAIDWTAQFRYSTAKIKDDTPSNQVIQQNLTLLSQAIPNFDTIWPNATAFGNDLSLENTSAKYLSVGGQYFLNNWQFYGEWSYTDSDNIVVRQSTTAHASLIYQLSQGNIFVSTGYADSDVFDFDGLNINQAALNTIPGGEQLYVGVLGTLSFFSSNQTTHSIGGRWDYSDKVAFKLQLDHVNLDEDGSTLWLTSLNNPLPAESFNIVFINMSFVF